MTALGLVTSLITFAVVVFAAFVVFLPTPPPPPSSRTPLTSPGPVITALLRNLNLSGLTVIPLVKLPRIKLPTISLNIHPTASEVVFHTLTLKSVSFRAPDAARESMLVKVKHVDLAVEASVGVRIELAGRWRWRSAGRINTSMEVGIESWLRLVQGAKTEARDAAEAGEEGATAPRLVVEKTQVDLGQIHTLILDGFSPFGTRMSPLIPRLKDSFLLRKPTAWLVSYLLTEVLESPVVQSLSEDLFDQGKQHLGVEMWEGIVDEERAQEVETGLREQKEDTAFRVQAQMVGPTLLRGFRLPDFAPPLYRPGGTREKLQAYNLLTGDFKLLLSASELSIISFDRSTISFEPTPASSPPPTTSPSPSDPATPSQPLPIGGGTLLVTVTSLTVNHTAHFTLSTDVSRLVAWGTGVKKLSTSGTATTVVFTHSLQLGFSLLPSPTSSAGYSLQSTSISPFTSVTPSISLESPLLNLGTDVVNSVTKVLATQIAKGVSEVVGGFMRKEVKEKLEVGIERVVEEGRMRGFEWKLDASMGEDGGS